MRHARIPARGRTTNYQPGTMNKTEEAYGKYLDQRVLAGEVAWWGFNKLKLRLATATFWDTDFFVQTADGFLEIHETKGFMRDDAAVKLKVAASQFPMLRVLLVKARPKREGGGWDITEIQP